MAEELTLEQRAAVDDRGRSLLVSAAAGSGKTKVLVERLFSYVERDGAQLDDFLVITYTRAAAAELRGKIARELTRRMQNDPTDLRLQRQLLRVYRADIKTVDAFCTALLRENCHLLGEDAAGRMLRPDFRVLDEQEAKLLKNRVLGEALERFYAAITPGSGAELLTETLGAGRGDDSLEQLVLELHAKLQAQSRPEEWLTQQEAFWRALPARLEDTPYGALLLDEVRGKTVAWRDALHRACAQMAENEALCTKYAPAFEQVASQLSALADAQSWETLRETEVVFPRLGAVKDADGGALKQRMKTMWEQCRDEMKKLSALTGVSPQEAMDELRAMAPSMLALLALTRDFFDAYQTEKRRRNAADFSDQEHEAIRLLLDAHGTPTPLAVSVSARYREIMVDEYQDTNQVQNDIFRAISHEGKNLFTVGDVKQSIYRFRLADPTIFLDHYRRYPSAAQAGEGEAAKLLLTRNFRSRTQVLEATNFIFRNILSRRMGELDYGEEESLHPGALYYPDDSENRCCAELHVLDIGPEEDETRRSAAECEADFLADYVRRLLDGGFPVHDGAGGTRQAREEDVVLLLRAPGARLAGLRRAFAQRGLSLAAEESGAFYETMEISVAFALLQIIDNPRQDVPLLAALRSPVFGFSPDRLAQLRAAARQGDFYDALLADGGEDVRAFLETLSVLRQDAQRMSVHELLFALYDYCHLPAIFGAMQNGRERRENLMAFAQLAKEQEKQGVRGVFAFTSQLRALLEEGTAPVPAAVRSAEGVRVMSIHKSKGLEFPIVIVCDLARGWNNMDFQSSVLVHPTLGLGPTFVDHTRRIRYPSIARSALELALRREAKAEELRLLYVAMTRAQEKLVLVQTRRGTAKKLAKLLPDAGCPALPEAVERCGCMGDWLLLPTLLRPEAGALRALAGADEEGLASCGDHPWHIETHDAADFRPSGPVQQAQQQRRDELPLDTQALEFAYPHAAAAALPAKLTATQLKGRAADAEIAENAELPPRLRSMERPRFLAQTAPLTGAERGTATHLALQYLDLAAAGELTLRAQLDTMTARRLLTPEQSAAVDVSALDRLLKSPLVARIRRARRVEREYRFSLLLPAHELLPGAPQDDEVLLQGVADLFFEEDGGLVVVDFKTDRVFGAAVARRAEEYRPQLETYALALSRVLQLPVRERVLYFLTEGSEVSV